MRVKTCLFHGGWLLISMSSFVACLLRTTGIHAAANNDDFINNTEPTKAFNGDDERDDDVQLCIVIKMKNGNRRSVCNLLAREDNSSRSNKFTKRDDNLLMLAHATLDNIFFDALQDEEQFRDGVNGRIVDNRVKRILPPEQILVPSNQAAIIPTRQRNLYEQQEDYDDFNRYEDDIVKEDEGNDDNDKEHEFERGEMNALQITICVVMTVICTSVAALAAGLTIGMLSIEPLQLLIKLRVGTQEEKQHAETLLPVVQQHHLLLVTLLLMNSVANEALPLYLEKLFPEYIAVLISVTLVLLVFGEILPSAIFTGQKQIAIAAKFTPAVRFLMWFFYPISYPIARALDKFLGHGGSDDDSHSTVADAFNRGEISALVRVIYEEQNRSKKETASTMLAAAATTLSPSAQQQMMADGINEKSRRNLHLDEVMMVEGALQMKTKTAHDVYRPIEQVFAVNEETILDEETIAELHACGHSRIPVYEDGPSGDEGEMTYDDEDAKKLGIKGILMTRNLIVVDWDQKRKLRSLPLLRPHCVSPSISLVDLINEFQRYGSHVGMAGHLAIVCNNPQLANKRLIQGNAIPKEAGVLGIVILEDVIEELLQEEIIDETDKMEVKTMRIARKVISQWRRFVQQKKAQRGEVTINSSTNSTAISLPFGSHIPGFSSNNGDGSGYFLWLT